MDGVGCLLFCRHHSAKIGEKFEFSHAERIDSTSFLKGEKEGEG